LDGWMGRHLTLNLRRHHYSAVQTRPDQIRPDQIRPDQIRPDQIRPDQIRPDQTRPLPGQTKRIQNHIYAPSILLYPILSYPIRYQLRNARTQFLNPRLDIRMDGQTDGW
jgi:hypothetical protein